MKHITEKYPESCQKSKMELFAKIVGVNYFRKKASSKIFDTVLSEYASVKG